MGEILWCDGIYFWPDILAISHGKNKKPRNGKCRQETEVGGTWPTALVGRLGGSHEE